MKKWKIIALIAVPCSLISGLIGIIIGWAIFHSKNSKSNDEQFIAAHSWSGEWSDIDTLITRDMITNHLTNENEFSSQEWGEIISNVSINDFLCGMLSFLIYAPVFPDNADYGGYVECFEWTQTFEIAWGSYLNPQHTNLMDTGACEITLETNGVSGFIMFPGSMTLPGHGKFNTDYDGDFSISFTYLPSTPFWWVLEFNPNNDNLNKVDKIYLFILKSWFPNITNL